MVSHVAAFRDSVYWLLVILWGAIHNGHYRAKACGKVQRQRATGLSGNADRVLGMGFGCCDGCWYVVVRGTCFSFCVYTRCLKTSVQTFA